MKRKIIFLCLIFSISVLTAQEKQVFRLEDLSQAMNQSNPDLLKLQEEYRQSLLDVKDAKAGLGPSIDLQITGTYLSKVPLDAIYLNVDDIINSIQWPTGTSPLSTGQRIKLYDGMENTYYTFGLTLQQPVWTWGKLTNAIKLYKQVADIKLTQIQNQQNQMNTELETRLISLSYLNKIMEIIDEEKIYAARLVEVSENAEKSGMLLHQDVVDAKIQAKELEIAQNDVVEQINNQLIELRRITGIDELTAENIEYEINEDDFTAILKQNKDELLKNALDENQLSLKMLSQLKEVNEISVEIAKGYENWKPDIAVQVTAGYGGSRFPLIEPNWYRKDDWSANISLGIKTTIWDGGKKLNDIARKKSATAVSELQISDARSTISQTFNTQWNTAEVCTMKIEYQDLKIESADSNIKQKQTVYETGYGSETDVLSAKMDRCNEMIEKEKQGLSRAAACMTIKFLVQK